MAVLSTLYHRYSVVDNWDDWSHWAVQAKNIFYTGKFPCAAGNSISLYLDYFPGIQIWEAFYMKIGNLFSDARLFVSYNMAIYIVFSGIISSVKNKKQAFLLAVVLVFSRNLFMFHAITSVTMDLFLSALLGYGLWLICSRKYNTVELLMTVSMLSLSKQVGCLFALILLAILFMELLIGWKRNNKSENLLYLKRLILCTFAEMAVVITWTMVKKLYGVTDTSSGMYKELLKTGIVNYINQLEEWHMDGFKNFWICFFNYKIVPTDSNTVFYLTPWIKVPAIVYILGLIAFMIYLSKNLNYKIYVVNILLILSGIAYALFLSSLYLLNFSVGEVGCLSSFRRYVGTYLLAVYFLEIGIFFTIDIKEGMSYNIIRCILIAVMLIIPNNTVSNFYYGLFSVSEQAHRREEYDAMQEKLYKAEELLDAIPEDNSQIVLDNASIVAVSEWNYLCFPAKVRLWGSVGGLWDSDDYLIMDSDYRDFTQIEEFKPYFQDGEPVDGGLYKIIRANDSYKFEQVDGFIWK